MPLSDVELRVLGALIEKDRTTPENYPLSAQGLVTACNQRTSRDPVTDLHLQEVLAAVNRLKDRGLVEIVQEAGDRVPKHRHNAMSALDLDGRELAVLAILMLRGPQTPGELRSRSERYVDFPDVAAVERTLVSLADRSAPLVANLGRSPGQSQDRWMHSLGTDESKMAPRVRAPRGADEREDGSGTTAVDEGRGAASASGGGRSPAGAGEARDRPSGSDRAPSYQELLHRIEALERRVEQLELGD